MPLQRILASASEAFGDHLRRTAGHVVLVKIDLGEGRSKPCIERSIVCDLPWCYPDLELLNSSARRPIKMASD